jgi:hypothetical protein
VHVKVNVGVAIFVLPFNSALNPFFYTLNLYLERRRKVKASRAMTKKRALTQLNSWMESSVFSSYELISKFSSEGPVVKDTALALVRSWLQQGVVTLKDFYDLEGNGRANNDGAVQTPLPDSSQG